MSPIFNATQHKASQEQLNQGVIDFSPEVHNEIKRLITFDGIPTKSFLQASADSLVKVLYDAVLEEIAPSDLTESQKLALELDKTYPANHFIKVTMPKIMVGGAPFFASILENTLVKAGFKPVYAFSQRVSEEKLINNEVIKTNVFKHVGFYEVN